MKSNFPPCFFSPEETKTGFCVHVLPEPFCAHTNVCNLMACYKTYFWIEIIHNEPVQISK